VTRTLTPLKIYYDLDLGQFSTLCALCCIPYCCATCTIQFMYWILYCAVMTYCTVVAKVSDTALGVCFDPCFAQINLAFGE